MRMMIFNGSPRGKNGNNHILDSAFADGARDAGAEVETVFLSGSDIRPCKGCHSCWFGNPGECVQDDDMAELMPRIIDSDVIVFSSPLFVDNVSGLMKNFMDRLIPLGDPHMERDEEGECRHVKRYDKPSRIVVVSNCGFPEQSHFQVLRLLFQRVARNFHCEVAAEIYRGAGVLLRSKDPQIKPAVDDYLALVREAGREIVDKGRLTKRTTTKLDKPLMPMKDHVDIYITKMNRYCDDRTVEKDPA